MNKLFIQLISVSLILWIVSSCATKGLIEESTLNGTGDQANSPGKVLPVKIESYPLDIIPPASGVKFYRDGIVFLADSKTEEKISSGHLSFGIPQAYYATVGDTAVGPNNIFSPKVTFPYPCDAIGFSDNFGTMYFTKQDEKDKKEKIYRAEAFLIADRRQEWTIDSSPLEFCKEGSVYTHPAISVDGSIMIIASDMQGSAGGMDLFISRNENMRWSAPVNLGKLINTTGNEIFPALDRKNNLFFSSNGLPGCEGYDIFISRYNGKGWDSPVRLTKYINSKSDEIAFTIDNISGNSAFYTSRLISRRVNTQLYRIIPDGKSSVAKNKDLSALLYDMSVAEMDSTAIKAAAKRQEAERIKADSIEKARIEAEKFRIAKARADSLASLKLNAQKLQTDKVKAAKMKADSLATAKLNAQKFQADKVKASKMRADSLAMAKLNAQRLDAEKIRAAKLRSDSIMAVNRSASEKLAAERAKAAKVRNDSILAAKKAAERLDAERLRIAQIKADSIMSAKKESEKLEAMRIKAERLRLDSLEAIRLEADRKANPDIITYKVQFLTTVKPRERFHITVDGVVYNAVEYYYLKEYRYTVGEFSTLEPAKYLQYGCRRSGYPQAFVVAFKNGQRSLDMGLFK